MFGSEILEVGAGMAFLFMFMSLMATVLREAIENFFKSRSTDLEKGIKELLDHARDAQIVQDFYQHPVIASLYKGVYVPGGKALPSYIPRASFSLAILDLVAGASQNGKPLSVDLLQQSLSQANPPTAVQRVILTAIGTAETDLVKIRTAIEAWYDGTMDRVSGWYSRRTGRFLFVIGLLAAVTFNVDAITVAKHLIQDKALRDTVIAQAKNYTAPPQADSAAPPAAGVSIVAQEKASIEDVAAINGRLSEVGLPIGWTYKDGKGIFPTPQACWLKKAGPVDMSTIDCEASPTGWVTAFAGWTITALAIMLGAPFWFDVLNKFMVIRSTVKPSEKSPDEASIDRQPPPASPIAAPVVAEVPAHAALEDSAVIANASAAAVQALSGGNYAPLDWANNPNGPQAGVI